MLFRQKSIIRHFRLVFFFIFEIKNIYFLLIFPNMLVKFRKLEIPNVKNNNRCSRY